LNFKKRIHVFGVNFTYWNVGWGSEPLIIQKSNGKKQQQLSGLRSRRWNIRLRLPTFQNFRLRPFQNFRPRLL